MDIKSAALKNPLIVAAVACAVLSFPLSAATLKWDSLGTSPVSPFDGGGIWDLTTISWSNGSMNTAWNNASSDIAVFGNANGSAGIVTLGAPITLGGLTFNPPSSGNYITAPPRT